jgi:PhnB protein
MPVKSLNPYINLNGTAAEALAYYEKALGAKVQDRMTFAQLPPEMQNDPTMKDRIMHATFKIGDALMMISDTMPNAPVAAGGNVQIALHYTDPAEMVGPFEALAAGGKVTQPLIDTFWGAKFGMLMDRFGVEWMFNAELKK